MNEISIQHVISASATELRVFVHSLGRARGGSGQQRPRHRIRMTWAENIHFLAWLPTKPVFPLPSHKFSG